MARREWISVQAHERVRLNDEHEFRSVRFSRRRGEVAEDASSPLVAKEILHSPGRPQSFGHWELSVEAKRREADLRGRGPPRAHASSQRPGSLVAIGLFVFVFLAVLLLGADLRELR